MLKIRTVRELIKKENLKGKKVLLRVDLNVPVSEGKVTDLNRIEAVLPSIKALIDAKAKVILISHFGRPKPGFDTNNSLAPIVDDVEDALSKFIGKKTTVKFGVDCIGASAKSAVDSLNDGEVVLLENLRFHSGEEKNDKKFVNELASIADIYVNDAFSCSHRAHASITGVAEILPSYAGLCLENELVNLESALNSPKRPLAAIVGGAKISTKIDILEQLTTKVDYIMIGGGMANTFLNAQGKNIGKSLFEKDYKDTAKKIMKKADSNGCKILLPTDAAMAKAIDAPETTRIANIDSIEKDEMILDIGIETAFHWHAILQTCKTVIWNGPVGAFEFKPYDSGSVSIARTIASLTEAGKINSVAGGGDVVAAVTAAGVKARFSYISTAGGAFLEWLEGKELPGVKVLS
jgi:phosphoglycerate kinase